MLVQAQCLEEGLVIMGFTGGATLDGDGDHVILAPAYNITEKEVVTIVDILCQSAEHVLDAHKI